MYYKFSCTLKGNVFFRFGFRLNKLSCSISNSQKSAKYIFLVVSCRKKNNIMSTTTEKKCNLHTLKNVSHDTQQGTLENK